MSVLCEIESDGSLNCHKAHLVALGNKQEYGLNYDETFALVAKMIIVRTVRSIVASKRWYLHQTDVKNVFLHDDLTENIYMTPSQSLLSSSNGVCKLKRSLYGLKQAPKAWYGKFHSTILGFSFTQSRYDSSIFIHITSARELSYFFCMSMIWLLLALIMLSFKDLNNNYMLHFI